MALTITKTGPFFTTVGSAISFSKLRENFILRSDGSVSASNLVRNAIPSQNEPIVPDATENTGISSTKNDAKITIVGVKDRPGIAASIFKPLSQNLINVDMVVQNISLNGKETDLTFTIKSDDLKKTEKLIKQNNKISYKKLSFDKNVSKVSIIGVGMITTPGITYRMFQSFYLQHSM